MTRLSCFTVIGGIILAAFLNTSVLAQNNKGTISGQVIDPSGGVVQGAQVHLQAQGITAASDTLGAFVIPNLVAGDYKLEISYVGFKPFETTITLKAGEDHHVEAHMEVASANQSITVTDQVPHGEAESINRTRAADNILQVLPAEVITSLPNANVADALGRMPSIALQRSEGEGEYVQVRGNRAASYQHYDRRGLGSFPRAQCPPDPARRHSSGSR